MPSLNKFVQNFISEKKTFHLKLQDFGQITQKVYGGAITLGERQNYTTYEFNVEKDVNFDKEETNFDILEAVDSGVIFDLKIVLDDLCSRGLIEEGKYFIRYAY